MNTNLHVKTRLLAPGIVAALLAALPASASATDYCVAPNTGCGGTDVASFEQALDLADNLADSDRILLGAASYTAPTNVGFNYSRADAPVEIVGQGTGQTLLTAPAGAHRVLRLTGGASSSVHDVTLRLPENTAVSGEALRTSDLAQRVEVIEDPTQSNQRWGVNLEQGGTLEDSTVTIGSGQETYAVLLQSGGGTVRRSVLSARVGVSSGYGGTVERSRLTTASTGVVSYRNTLQVSASVIRFATNVAAAGMAASVQSGYDSAVNADSVTLIGGGVPGTRAAGASTSLAPGQNASVSLTNSVIRGAPSGFVAGAPGAGTATVTASWSDYDPAGNTTIGANGDIVESNVSNVGDAGFADAATGDYRLLPGSPLIDAGDPATAQGLDLGGNPLVADGNGDGTARRDLGAFELQPAPAGGGDQPPAGDGREPPASDGGQPPAGDPQPAGTGGEAAGADTVAPLLSGLRVARRARLRYRLSEPARVTLRLQRARPGGRGYRTVARLGRNGKLGANGVRLRARVARPGRYRVVAIATDAAGNRSAPRTVRFRVTRG